MTAKTKQYSKVPVGKFSRSATAGAAAAKIGAKRLSLLSKKPFMSSQGYESARKKYDDDAARTLFEALTQLRGSALKMAQILSLEMGILPEVYRKELQKSHYQVPPLNRAVVRRLLISEFGKEPEKVFREFEPEAFAAASLGQVHRAIGPGGERLAVKVQYPGIASALKNDVELVKRFLPRFFKSEYIADMSAEIERRLLEEIDYLAELEQTRWFGEKVRTPGVVIPKVHPELSTRLVLSTEHLEGQHLDPWLARDPSQELRDRAAQTMWDLFLETYFEHKRIHTDPNPGNYLFRDGGEIGLIDFGSVKSYTSDFVREVGAIWDGYVRGDEKEVRRVYLVLGLSEAAFGEFYQTTLKPFGDWTALPFQTEIFDFGANPGYCEAGLRYMQRALNSRAIDGFTTENVMFDRNVHGLYRIFSALKAKVRLRNSYFGPI